MSSEEYIKTQLKDLIVQFPETRVRYVNDEYNNAHLIEIIPNETYHNNSDFKKIEKKIIFSFIEKYQFENIVFLSGDDDYSIGNVYWEIIGSSFDAQDATVFSDDLSKSVMAYTASTIISGMQNELLADYSPEYNNTHVDLSKDNILQTPAIAYIRFEYADTHSLFEVDAATRAVSTNNSNPAEFEKAGENNYALAA